MTNYRQLGLTPIINAAGPVTRLGGAPMPAAALDAFREASRESMSLEAVQAVASARIARATGTEAGLVTSGASAALTLAAAAVLAGNDPARMERLPGPLDFPHAFVIARDQRSGYDHAVRAAGARLVEVGYDEINAQAGVRRAEIWEYEAAFGEETAGVVYALRPGASPPLEEVVRCAHERRLPVIVDAAGQLPPRRHLTRIAATGADLVCFSGGKAIRGPQSTGILCGRRRWIASAAVQMLDMDEHRELWSPPAEFIDATSFVGLPRHGIGRSMKVSKEEIAALLVALDLFAGGAHEQRRALERSMLSAVEEALAGAPVQCLLREGADKEASPILELHIDAPRCGRSALEVCRHLRQGEPPVYLGTAGLAAGILTVEPSCLREEHVPVLARRLRDAFAEA